MYCGKCGKKLEDDVRFCTKCGAPLQSVSDQPKVKPPSKKKAPLSTGVTVAVVAGVASLLVVMGVLVASGFSGHGERTSSEQVGQQSQPNPSESSGAQTDAQPDAQAAAQTDTQDIDNSSYDASLFNIAMGSRVVELGDYLYYIGFSKCDGVYRCKKDGTENEQLYGAGDARGTRDAGHSSIRDLNVCKDYLVFADGGSNGAPTSVVALNPSDGTASELALVQAGRSMSLQVVGDRIYCVDDGELYSMTLGATGVTREYDGMSEDGGWIIHGTILYVWDSSVRAVDRVTKGEDIIYSVEGSVGSFVPFSGRYYVRESSSGVASDLEASKQDYSFGSTDASEVTFQKVVSISQDGSGRVCYFAIPFSADDKIAGVAVLPGGELACMESVYFGPAYVRMYSLDGVLRSEVTVDLSTLPGYPRATVGLDSQYVPHVTWFNVVGERVYTIPSTYAESSQSALVSMDATFGDARVLAVG